MRDRVSYTSMSVFLLMAIGMILFMGFATTPSQGASTLVDGTCSGTLWNGTIKTDDCPTDCDTPQDPLTPGICEDHWGYTCECASDLCAIGTTCIRVCNQSGQVIDIQCVCFCACRHEGQVPPEPNCPSP